MVFSPSEFLPEYRAAKKFSLFSSNGWWLNRWPLLGWLETFIKIAAWLTVPYIPADTSSQSISSISPQFAIQTTIMLVASVLLLAAIIDRLVYRELISIIFVFPNNWAHWSVLGMMYQYGRGAMNGKYFRIFLWLMVTGDIVKLLFFAVHDFSRIGVAVYVLYVLTALFAAMYGAILFVDYGYGNDWAVKVANDLSLQELFARIKRI